MVRPLKDLECSVMHYNLVSDTDKSSESVVSYMPEKGEVVARRYKVQTKDRFGEWADFGPFYFSTHGSVEEYLDEHKKTIGKSRIVEVVETVLRYVG
jgi:hypothetical protein